MRICLEGGCTAASECAPLAASTHDQLATGRYDFPASVFALPDTFEAYLLAHRTVRKRVAHARSLGYQFETVDRTQHERDVYDVNTSTPERQGRPMTDGYRQTVTFSPLPAYECERHGVHTYGVLDSHGTLRAYTWVYRVGELVMFSQILGHAAHLANNVMYLLLAGAVEAEIANGYGTAFYNMHNSGTDGLRFFKERCGFAPARVGWVLQ